jgi:YfiH family protein
MEDGLITKNVMGIKVINSQIIGSIPNVRHFFSTRVGGISEGFFSSLNLGIYTEDSKDKVSNNLMRILSAVEMNQNKIVYLKQIHSDRFHVVNEDNYMKIKETEGDALITTSKEIAIGVFTADCVPILLADDKRNLAAVVHAGWRGTNLNIVYKVLDHIINIMGSAPQNIKAALGPSIGKCCFEVKNEVAEKFKHVKVVKDRWYIDLLMENIDQIKRAGVPDSNIDYGELCTSCNPELFYSFRRDKGITGRLGTFIQII